MTPIPFDDRDGFIYFNGEFVEWRQAKIHVLNHGLHYASSVFEGTRIYNGKIFKNTEHNTRLHRSAEILDFEIENNVEEINELCYDVCKKNNIINGYIRPVAWRGSEQMQISAKNTKIHFAIAAWSWPSYYSDEMKKLGLKLKVAKYKRPHPETAPTEAKAGCLYSICTISKHEAERDGFADCLMLDYRGYVAEGTGANFFAIFDGEIHTPKADCFLNGLTRQTVIRLAKDLGYNVVERHIEFAELKNAQDAFFTGTAAEVTKIGSVTSRDLKETFEFKENKISLHLLSSYRDLVCS